MFGDVNKDFLTVVGWVFALACFTWVLAKSSDIGNLTTSLATGTTSLFNGLKASN